MNKEVSDILQEALKLPIEARAALAGSVLESLDEVVDDSAEVARAEEIAKRVADLDAGKAKTIPWSKARQITFMQEPELEASVMEEPKIWDLE